ncbi:MAG: hypothetical protein ABFD79_08250 [Phycisphaerales bacterium]
MEKVARRKTGDLQLAIDAPRCEVYGNQLQSLGKILLSYRMNALSSQ